MLQIAFLKLQRMIIRPRLGFILSQIVHCITCMAFLFNRDVVLGVILLSLAAQRISCSVVVRAENRSYSSNLPFSRLTFQNSIKQL